MFYENPLILLAIVLWTLPWKGAALWLAARNSHKRWFIVLLVLNTLAVLDIAYIFFFGRSRKEAKETKETKGTKDARDMENRIDQLKSTRKTG